MPCVDEHCDGDVSEPQQPRHRFARLATEVLSPIPVAGVLLIVVAIQSASSVVLGIEWALLGVLFTSVLPFTYLSWAVGRQQLTDRHVKLREQRPRTLLVGIGLVIIGLVLLAVLGAPRPVIALLAAIIAGLVIALAVTLVWKISLHAAGAAGTVVILALVFGPVWLALSPLVGLVGWARVELGDHTTTQVSAGAVIGALVAAVVFTLLR